MIVGLVGCKKEPIVPEYTIETISGSGGTLLPFVGKIEVTHGDSLTITPKPDNGYEVDFMKVDGNIITVPISLSYTFKNVISDHLFEVTYKKVVPNVKMVTVETSVGPGGTINPLGITQVDSGGSLAIVLTPDPGFAPDSVILNGISHPYTENIYDLFNITADTKVKVVFGKTNLWYLIQGHWIISKIEARQVNTVDWYNQTLGNPEFNFDLAFNSQYNYYDYNEKGELVGNGPYTLTTDSLILGQQMGQFRSGGIRNKIILLNGDTLEVRRTNDFYDQYGNYVPSRNIEIQTFYKIKK